MKLRGAGKEGGMLESDPFSMDNLTSIYYLEFIWQLEGPNFKEIGQLGTAVVHMQ